MKVYDIILYGNSGISAIDYAKGIDFSEIEEIECSFPYINYKWVATVADIDIYYNVVADYYMFANTERS